MFAGGRRGVLRARAPGQAARNTSEPSVVLALVPRAGLCPQCPAFLLQALTLVLEIDQLTSDLVPVHPNPLHPLGQIVHVHHPPAGRIPVALPGTIAQLDLEVVTLTTADGRDL